MHRDALTDLESWLGAGDRKPLVIRGARQVGKTWLIRKLAERSGRSLLELNFEFAPQDASLFVDRDPAQVVARLEARFGGKVDPDSTLVFLDEIQAAPELFANLWWFAEDMPELPVVAAGSLLDFVLADHEFSMPVGRISYLHLDTVTFSEFLGATGEDGLLDYIGALSLEGSVPAALHARLLARYREYVFVGGMPAAVQNWAESGSPVSCSEVHHRLVATYRDDFHKYRKRVPIERLIRVFDAVPRMLGSKFMFSRASPDDRAAQTRQVLDLLCKARVCTRVQASHGTGIPLGAAIRERVQKVLFVDVGLAGASLGLSLDGVQSFDRVAMVNSGALLEQAIGQSLRSSLPRFMEPALFYWVREEKGAEAELDYLLQCGPDIVPVEVKSGRTGSLKSLHLFMALRGLPLAVRFNADAHSVTQVHVQTTSGRPARYTLLSLPFYLCDQVRRLVDEARDPHAAAGHGRRDQ
ncbi:MAG: ATP-binding protein [Kiritimatiellae bacterium]|nr:ATP-binding protein [Kiritimatiellia bacterium]